MGSSLSMVMLVIFEFVVVVCLEAVFGLWSCLLLCLMLQLVVLHPILMVPCGVWVIDGGGRVVDVGWGLVVCLKVLHIVAPWFLCCCTVVVQSSGDIVAAFLSLMGWGSVPCVVDDESYLSFAIP